MQVDKQARQGDVPIIRIEVLPADAKLLPRDEHNRVVLAHGEHSGHAHTFRDPSVCGFSMLDDNEIEFFVIGGGGGATLNHELVTGEKAEHDPIAFAPGIYEVPVQVEYSPEELRTVID